MAKEIKVKLFEENDETRAEKTMRFIRQHTVALLLIVTLIFLVIGVALSKIQGGDFIQPYVWWSSAFYKAAQLIFVSAILSAILDSLQYRKYFQTAIFEATHSNKYLKTRTKSDLNDLWDRVTRIAYDEKFPELNEPLLDRVKTGYLPRNKEYYYKKYNRTCNADWVPGRERDILHLKDKITFTIIPHRVSQSVMWEFRFSRSPGVSKDTPNSINLGVILVNGEERKPELLETEDENEIVYGLQLEGKEKYEIVRESERQFCPRDDPYSKYTSPQFTLGTTVKVHCHPTDLRVKFLELGTLENFDPVNPPLEKGRKGDIDRDYEGMVFPQQGYALVWQILDTAEGVQIEPDEAPKSSDEKNLLSD